MSVPPHMGAVSLRSPREQTVIDAITTQRDVPFVGDKAGMVNAFHMVLLRVGGGVILKSQFNANMSDQSARDPHARGITFRVMATTLVRQLRYPMMIGSSVWGRV